MMFALIVPLSLPGHPDHLPAWPGRPPVDPGYGVEAPVYPDQGLPGWSGRPSHPIYPTWPVRPGHLPSWGGRPVDPGYGVDPGVGSPSHPIVIPPGGTVPPTVWPPAPGSPSHPIELPGDGGASQLPIYPVYPGHPLPPDWSNGAVIVWIPGVGWGAIPLPPRAQPKK